MSQRANPSDRLHGVEWQVDRITTRWAQSFSRFGPGVLSAGVQHAQHLIAGTQAILTGSVSRHLCSALSFGSCVTDLKGMPGGGSYSVCVCVCVCVCV